MKNRENVEEDLLRDVFKRILEDFPGAQVMTLVVMSAHPEGVEMFSLSYDVELFEATQLH